MWICEFATTWSEVQMPLRPAAKSGGSLVGDGPYACEARVKVQPSHWRREPGNHEFPLEPDEGIGAHPRAAGESAQQVMEPRKGVRLPPWPLWHFVLTLDGGPSTPSTLLPGITTRHQADGFQQPLLTKFHRRHSCGSAILPVLLPENTEDSTICKLEPAEGPCCSLT